jgi:hypothetical protein
LVNFFVLCKVVLVDGEGSTPSWTLALSVHVGMTLNNTPARLLGLLIVIESAVLGREQERRLRHLSAKAWTYNVF